MRSLEASFLFSLFERIVRLKFVRLKSGSGAAGAARCEASVAPPPPSCVPHGASWKEDPGRPVQRLPSAGFGRRRERGWGEDVVLPPSLPFKPAPATLGWWSCGAPEILWPLGSDKRGALNGQTASLEARALSWEVGEAGEGVGRGRLL